MHRSVTCLLIASVAVFAGCRSVQPPAVSLSGYMVSISDVWPYFSADVFACINAESKEISDYMLGWYEGRNFRMIIIPGGGEYSVYVANSVGRDRVSDERIRQIGEIIEARMFALSAAEKRGEKIRHVGVAPLDEFLRSSSLTKDLPDLRAGKAESKKKANKPAEPTALAPAEIDSRARILSLAARLAHG